MALKCNEKMPGPSYFTRMEQVSLVGGRALGSHVAGNGPSPRYCQLAELDKRVVDAGEKLPLWDNKGSRITRSSLHP